jgi:hypothetical protein
VQICGEVITNKNEGERIRKKLEILLPEGALMQNLTHNESRNLPCATHLLLKAAMAVFSGAPCSRDMVGGVLPSSSHGKFLYRSSLRMLSGLALVLCISVLSHPLHAQEFRASIAGQVTDSSGSALPGARITAVNVDTHVAYSAKSDGKGYYSVLYLLPGTYTVTVEATHFQKMVYNDEVLESAQKLGLNVSLKPGGETQKIVVTANPLDLDTVSGSTGGVIDQYKVQNMPSTGLQVFDDVSFTEGIRAASANTFSYTLRNNSNTYAVAGSQLDENAFYVNGAPMSDINDGGTWYFVPNQEATSQVQAGVMPYDAQYGRTGGGVFSVNIKNGTNTLHGSVYDYYGNSFIDANTWSNDRNHVQKPLNIHNTFGADAGGPIRRGKTFFFGSYEGFRQDEPTVIQESVPAPAWRTGDFSGSPYKIFDPLSTRCVKKTSSGCAAYRRTEFPNDTIPVADLSPIGKALVALYPQPTDPTAYVSNYTVKRQTNYSYDQYIGRIDQNFTNNTRMYLLTTLQNDGFINAVNAFTTAGSAGITNPVRDYNIITDLTHLFSPFLVGDLKASYGHYEAITIGNSFQNNVLSSVFGFNMPAVGNTSHQNVVPNTTVAGMAALFNNSDSGGAAVDADFSGSITQVVGHHNLHYGFEFTDTQSAPVGIPGNPNGDFTFDSTFTRVNPLAANAGSGNEVADLLMGYPTVGSVTWGSNVFKVFHYYGAYLQDDYQVLPTLTLNLGLRWDVNSSVSDRQNRMNAGFCLTCVNPYSSQVNVASAPGLQGPLLGGWQFAGVNGMPSAPFKVYWNDWQPRVGFAWAVLPNTVVRGGYGIYDTIPYASVNQVGFSQTTSFIGSLDGRLTPDSYFNSGTPYPSGVIAPTGASAGLATDVGNGVGFQNLNRRIRMTQHWSFGIQQRMPAATLLDIEYLGSVVHNIPVATSLGVVSTSQQEACLAGGDVCNNNVANPFYGVLASNTPLGASTTIPAWELMRAYPLFNGVVQDAVPSGDSHFNSFNVRVERKLQNLEDRFNYAYANWMDIDSYLNNGSFRDAKLWKGLDPNDQRNYLDANLVYPLPSTRKRGILGALANGWLFDSTVMWGTGHPLALPSANLTGAPGCTSYAPQGGQTREHWFNNNESCWTQLVPWQPRTTPLYVGFIREPGFTLWNPAFHKQFPLHREGTYAIFRMEAVNGANHPTFGPASLAINTPALYRPTTNWTGFGTLPNAAARNQRQFLTSLKVVF